MTAKIDSALIGSQPKVDPFDRLPDELIYAIFALLPSPRDLFICAQVCSRFKKITHDERFWITIAKSDYCLKILLSNTDPEAPSLRQSVHKVLGLLERINCQTLIKVKEEFTCRDHFNPKNYYEGLRIAQPAKLLEVLLDTSDIDQNSYSRAEIIALKIHLERKLLESDEDPNYSSLENAIHSHPFQLIKDLVERGARCRTGVDWQVASTIVIAILVNRTKEEIKFLIRYADALKEFDALSGSMHYACKLGVVKVAEQLQCLGVPVPEELNYNFDSKHSIEFLEWYLGKGYCLHADYLVNVHSSNPFSELVEWLLKNTSLKLPKSASQKSS